MKGWCAACRYDLLTLFQTGRSHMVVLTAPPRAPQVVEGVSAGGQEDPPVMVGTPPQNLSESIQEIKVSRTPPRRAKDEDVTLLGPKSHNACVANGDQVRFFERPIPSVPCVTDAAIAAVDYQHCLCLTLCLTLC